MYFIIVGMLLTLVLAAVVLALVAVPARRAGRVVLTPEGGQLIHQARERTSDVMDAAKDRVGDLADRLPLGSREPHAAGVSGLGATVGDRPGDPVTSGVTDPTIDNHPPIDPHPPIDLREAPRPVHRSAQ